MSEQACDSIIIEDGPTLFTYSTPWVFPPRESPDVPVTMRTSDGEPIISRSSIKFQHVSTGNYRGYVARWRIREGRLLLIGLAGTVDAQSMPQLEDRTDLQNEYHPDLRNVSLMETHGTDEPVVATWVSGFIRIPYGREPREFDQGRWMAPFFRRLTLQEGRVSADELVENVRWTVAEPEERVVGLWTDHDVGLRLWTWPTVEELKRRADSSPHN